MAKVVTPEFRVSYPNVFKAKKNDMNGKDEYSMVALFPKGADLSKVYAAAEEAITKKFGADKTKWPKGMRTPFRKQEDRKKKNEETGKETLPAGYEEGAIYLNLKSESKPGLVDQNLQTIINPSDFYAGCFARASLDFYAYDTKGNKGVTCGLGNIQKVRDGDPLGGRTKPEDDFAPVGGPAAAPASADALFN